MNFPSLLKSAVFLLLFFLFCFVFFLGGGEYTDLLPSFAKGKRIIQVIHILVLLKVTLLGYCHINVLLQYYKTN